MAFFFLPAWKKEKIGQLVLVETNWFACFGQKGNNLSIKRKNGRHGFPVAQSIHLTDTQKTWLCILYWPRPLCISTEKIYSVALVSCRQCGKWIKTRIKWTCPFPPGCSNCLLVWCYPRETEQDCSGHISGQKKPALCAPSSHFSCS